MTCSRNDAEHRGRHDRRVAGRLRDRPELPAARGGRTADVARSDHRGSRGGGEVTARENSMKPAGHGAGARSAHRAIAERPIARVCGRHGTLDIAPHCRIECPPEHADGFRHANRAARRRSPTSSSVSPPSEGARSDFQPRAFLDDFSTALQPLVPHDRLGIGYLADDRRTFSVFAEHGGPRILAHDRPLHDRPPARRALSGHRLAVRPAVRRRYRLRARDLPPIRASNRSRGDCDARTAVDDHRAARRRQPRHRLR